MRGSRPLQLVRVGFLQQLQDIVQPHLDVVGLGLLADVLPARLLRAR